MIPDHIAKHLKRAIESGQASLFLGPGFSSECKNALGRSLPFGDELAKLLWGWLAYKEEYDGSPLAEVFDAAIASGRKREELEMFLRDHLLVAQVPPWYDELAKFPWYRIYTSNIDDAIETTYLRIPNISSLVVKVNGINDYEERDPVWRTVQLIKLNGDVRQHSQHVAFRVRPHQNRAGKTTWTEHFLRDYGDSTIIFIGNHLREPLLWDNLEARGKRASGEGENRPRSYLVTRAVSPPKKAILEDLNVFPVEMEPEGFFAYLQGLYDGSPPDRMTVLGFTKPHIAALERGGEIRESRRIEKVFSCFRTVPTEKPTSQVRGKAFLLGVPPAWEDILRDLDAPRAVNRQLEELISHAKDTRPLVLMHGSAGCGKSTVLKRVGLSLARAGHFTLFTEGEVFPPIPELADYMQNQPAGKSVILIDNASMVSATLPRLWATMQKLGEHCPAVVCAARTNDLDRWRSGLPSDVSVVELQVPHLEDADISALVDLLRDKGLLGVLEGRPRPAQEAAFRQVAQRQILVAMREATQGRGFDKIIENEFESLPRGEAQVMYLVGALATALDFKLTRDELLGCSEGPLNTALERMDRSLSGILVPVDETRSQYVLRHRVIAEHVLDATAPRVLLREAYERLIVVLALDMGRDPHRQSRVFRLYRALINHRPMYRRFGNAIAEARSVYDRIQSIVSHDYHYWLQYGLLELDYGTIDLATPYLESARELDGNDDYVHTAVAHLRFRQSLEASSLAEAEDLRREGEVELRRQIDIRGDRDYKVYHLLASQLLAWANRWCRTDRRYRFDELTDALKVAKVGVAKHRHSRELGKLQEDLQRAVLEAAISD